ncbi:uncharacterized protein LOC135931854 isoform X2 [Gordionus sp. m RMFG-2023]|uniref:uncharacterized protein LOC135931854 isoform X2 n=1 Tax=Gordionus sp. m RMFG-2023 TaxID=3053472 RepID=UPI0031FCD934
MPYKAEINEFIKNKIRTIKLNERNPKLKLRQNISYIVCALIVEDDRILLLQEIKYPFTGKWYIPGGKLTYRENLGVGACRETLEETGIKCHPISLISVECDKGKWFRCIFHCSPQGGTLKTYPNKHSLKADWFSITDIYQDKINLRYNDLKSILQLPYVQNLNKKSNNIINPILKPHKQLTIQLIILCYIKKIIFDNQDNLPLYYIYQYIFTSEMILRNYVEDIFDANTQPYFYKLYGILNLEHCAFKSNDVTDGFLMTFLIKLMFKNQPIIKNINDDNIAPFKITKLRSLNQSAFKTAITNNYYVPFKFVHLLP